MTLKLHHQEMRKEDWLTVRSTAPLSDFPEAVVHSLIKGRNPQEFDKGTAVFRQGEKATSFFIILSGMIKITRLTPKGAEVVVGIVHSGEIIGETAMFLDSRYPVGAEVIETSRLLSIEGTEIVAQIKKKPSFALQILALASNRFGSLVEQIERMKGLNGEQRVADYLLRLCPNRMGACSVELPCEKRLIAFYLGITPQTFSRTLVRLRALGVSVDRDTIKIADVERLYEFAEA